MIDKPSVQRSNWKRIGPLKGMVYAEMAANLLTQNEVPHYVSQDGLSAVYGVHGASLVGNVAFIYVPDEFYEIALQLIERILDNQ